MLEKLMCILVLGTLAASASAQALWDFSYRGFFYTPSSRFEPNWTESGLFAGTDSNGNGLLERQELTRFSWQQIEYVKPYGCPLMQCELSSFSFNLHTGQLSFASDWSYRDDMAYSTGSTMSGDRIHVYGYVGEGGGSSEDLLWTSQTQFNIAPAPVPEPPMFLMLLLGCSLLLWRRMSLPLN